MRDEDVKVRQIREAAKELFLRHGFAGVSTAALAKGAGVSKETLYTRYPSKEAVLADVLEHLIFAGQPQSRPPDPPLGTLADLERALNRFAGDLAGQLMRREYIELARIVIAETPRLPEVGVIFRRAVPERALGGVARLLTRARDHGIVREVDPMVAARMFVGPIVVHMLINVMLVAPSADEDGPPPPFETGPHVALFLSAVTAGSAGEQ